MNKKSKTIKPTDEAVLEVKTISQALDEVLLSETAAKQLDAQAQAEPVKKPGIGKFIVEQILTMEKSNTEILNEVIKEFDGAKTTMACIAWYKTKMRKEGKIPPRSVKTEKTEKVPAWSGWAWCSWPC